MDRVFAGIAKLAGKDFTEDLGKKFGKDLGTDAAKKEEKELLTEAGAKIVKKTAIGAGALAAVGLAGYTLINPQVQADNINKTTYTISSIKDNSGLFSLTTYTALVSYSPGQSLAATDTITISGSDCVPSIDGTYSPNNTVSPTQVEIVVPVKLTKMGTKGTMKIQTSYNTQLNATTKAEGQTVGSAAGGAAGGLAGGAASALGATGSGILAGLGISTTMFIIIVILLVLCSSSSLAMFIVLR